MAILKQTVRKEVPQPLMETPVSCPEHRPGPVPECHHHCDHPHPAPEVHLHNSFRDAVLAAQKVFLRPGEARTEFYTNEGEIAIHCILALGNIDPNQGHLILSDTGRLNSIDTQLEALKKDYTKQIKDLKKETNESINAINDILDTYAVNFTNITNQLASINSTINDLDNELLKISDSVEKVDQKITALSITLGDQITDINTQITVINSSIAEIESKFDELDHFDPIQDASIVSLFHDDIYTVNLCCFTMAGHIEVDDTDGYDKDRVAACTPDDQYKTYVAGDKVKFTAKTNTGYKFLGWYVDGELQTTNAEIEYVFDAATIFEPALGLNVIGTLADGVERDILQHGYTALYRELNTIKYDIKVITADAEQFNDSLTIKVNGAIVKDAPYYFDDGDTVEIIANPQSNHNFVKYVINSVEYTDSAVKFAACKETLVITAFFEEIRYYLCIEAVPSNKGEIKTDKGNSMTHIAGTVINATAIPEHADDQFVKWVDHETGRQISTTNPLKIVMTEEKHIDAIFE